MTAADALAAAQARGIERLDAMLLLAHHLGRRREWVMAHADEALDARVCAAFERDCARRADAVPLAYLTGRREFHGLELDLTPDVLVPRPETEGLADWAIEILQIWRTRGQRPRVIDLGTGSGALALAIAAACPWADVHAIDLSGAALAVAAKNAQRFGLPVTFSQGSWWQGAEPGHFDIAVANPPYVAAGDPHLWQLRHEPIQALVAGPQGLDALHQIVAGAVARLSGWLLLEHGWDQAEAVRTMLGRAGFRSVTTRADLHGHPRCSGGSRT